MIFHDQYIRLTSHFENSELAARGVDPARIFASLNQRKPSSEPLAMGRMLMRTEFHAQGRLAYIDQPLDAEGTLMQDGDALLDVLRSVGSVEVVLYLRELQPGVHKLSFDYENHILL